MRKEKEWKRTLACKLYEERHHNMVEGDEGMDSLWETYESDSTKSMPTLKDVKKKSLKKKKSSDLDCYVDEDEDDDEVEMTNGHLCCLQAFKFSARKMNMGMGRTNIVKITKALRGIGWLHHIKKHDKKEKS
ncbi:Neurogenic differentiation factor 1 like [Heracleum sosnowskyi]|uniref:Neurogenic differentiation factor 1 like n=1 Tax=Heracleum sosnowskyi TaxID=360622 RepID=A0AAD8M8I2_9APIA|nr:Neurogenic differentiation factor 1 like [Heracleum sosnowskyi]